MNKEILKKKPVILMVDDDDEDVYLTKRAFSSQFENIVFKSVPDSEHFFEFLSQSSNGHNDSVQKSPDVVLLDINIPRENGFEILRKLRQDPKHGHLPVVMLTTSTSLDDVRRAYKLGASSFISKSVNSKEMKNIAANFCKYWFNFVKLPTSQVD